VRLTSLPNRFQTNAALRGKLRTYFMKNAILRSAGKTEEDSVYSAYYDYAEPVSKIAGHRVLR
jgi:uncharacterized protein